MERNFPLFFKILETPERTSFILEETLSDGTQGLFSSTNKTSSVDFSMTTSNISLGKSKLSMSIVFQFIHGYLSVILEITTDEKSMLVMS